jgi:hypothetical protein
MLIEDVKILPLVSGWEPVTDLAINGGINVIESGKYLENIKRPDKFHCGIYRPKSDWRPLRSDELNLLLGITEEADLANTVCLIEIPEDFSFRFYELKLDQMSISPAHWDEKMKSEFPDFAMEVRGWLEEKIFDEFQMCSAFVNFTRPGLDTTTFDMSQNRYRGLHIDNWGSPPRNARERDKCGIRVCINLGFEKRDIVFINLRLKSFLDVLSSRRNPGEVAALYAETYAQPLAEDFLNECIDYSVVKLSLKPCQGYIGPVQNIIHDGYSFLKRMVDVNLQLSANEFRYHADFVSNALPKGAKVARP